MSEEGIWHNSQKETQDSPFPVAVQDALRIANRLGFPSFELRIPSDNGLGQFILLRSLDISDPCEKKSEHKVDLISSNATIMEQILCFAKRLSEEQEKKNPGYVGPLAGTMMGWMCGRCNSVLSPFKQSCDCSSSYVRISPSPYCTWITPPTSSSS